MSCRRAAGTPFSWQSLEQLLPLHLDSISMLNATDASIAPTYVL